MKRWKFIKQSMMLVNEGAFKNYLNLGLLLVDVIHSFLKMYYY